MKQVIVTTALVGLLGLGAIYNLSSNSRARREVEVFDEGNDTEIVFQKEDKLNEYEQAYAFLDSMDWIKNPPDFLKDDVMIFQNEDEAGDGEGIGRAGKRKKGGGGGSSAKGPKVNLGAIKACMKTQSCYNAASAIPEKNANNLVSALAQADVGGPVHALENQLISETDPEDFSFPAEDVEVSALKASVLNTAVLTSSRMGFDIADGVDSAFEEGDALFAFIFPSGIPLTAGFEQTKETYAQYWKFFRTFTTNYVDPFVRSQAKAISIWTGREEKRLTWSLSKPAKVSKRFPYERFYKMLSAPVGTAYQPYMMKSYNTLFNSMQAHQAGKAEGHDCFIIWFHQHLPIDVAQFLDPTNEDLIQETNAMCTIVHIWVGFSSESQQEAVANLQPLLQPEQRLKTNADPNMRGYFRLGSHDELDDASFMRKVYTVMAVDRNRLACQMAVGSYVWPISGGEPDDLVDLQALEDAQTTGASIAATTLPMDIFTTAEEDATTEGFIEDVKFDVEEETIVVAGEPDMACCGIGFNGISYDANTSSCCDDGRVAAFNPIDGSDMCVSF